MAADPFNSISGYSVGIPAVPVINSNAVVVANINTDYVIANSVFVDNLRYANGQKYVPGSNTQVIFNNSNSFGSSANFTFNSSTDLLEVTNLAVPGTTNLGDVSQVSILGGVNGYVLQTDGMGTLSWVAQGGGGGNGNPGGANTQVQYNDSGSFNGSANFTFNENTNTLTVNNVVSNFTGNLSGTASNATVAITVSANSQPNITSLGTLTNLGVSGQVDALMFQGDAANLSNIPAANVVGIIPLANAVTNNAQPNITSLGTLTSLTSSGNIAGANVNASNRATIGNLFVTSNASVSGNFSMNTGRFIANGNIDLYNAVSVDLTEIEKLHIYGGFNGQVLTTDGTGNLSWTSGGGGGNGSPGGSNTQIQYNNNGSFAGTPYLTFNNVTNTMQVGGNLIANSFQMGSGVYHWSTSEVFFASTASAAADQLLYSIPVSQISGVEFEIIATNPTAVSRQFCKISSIYYDGTVSFNEYSSLFVNGLVGNFEVDYDAGNIVTPPFLKLTVTPASASPITYKMLISRYSP